MAQPARTSIKRSIGTILYRDFAKNKLIYLMALPVMAYYIIFHYGPMYGLVIAFKYFAPAKGILGSPWAGVYWFREFFNSYFIERLIKNTLLINVLNLLFSFPAPIILALLLNELRSERYKRSVQTITYLPHFISLVVICGMIHDFTSRDGIINDLVVFFGGERSTMLLNPGLFRPIYIVSEIWQGVGWGSIIYLAALSSIDPELYQAAVIDGANRWKKIWHITLPGIMPTIVILLILRVGSMMSIGHEKIILLYNASIYDTADVISSFVYRKGLLESNYSYSTAVGLFNSAINFMLVILANWLSRRATDHSLW
ncbi:MAG: sugar ABC transporter permease [Clostridiaceae bacterium]|jgi:putative aldouronate transport system permease protein|nr:ABC transporter permease subunit [Clostridiales bacterium]MDD2441214.1 ABC transporter permease subunit [Eubacteriales bacterium]MDD4139361.1 ABC transporter permease subunit [Eubacteriales bacterium]MDD4743585.1 ABC transporter permease subunit [Eubacteriales bacterium]NLB44734.1 sugar ABC transporter permease [Clostridiaceae bacterium]